MKQIANNKNRFGQLSLPSPAQIQHTKHQVLRTSAPTQKPLLSLFFNKECQQQIQRLSHNNTRILSAKIRRAEKSSAEEESRQDQMRKSQLRQMLSESKRSSLNGLIKKKCSEYSKRIQEVNKSFRKSQYKQQEKSYAQMKLKEQEMLKYLDTKKLEEQQERRELHLKQIKDRQIHSQFQRRVEEIHQQEHEVLLKRVDLRKRSEQVQRAGYNSKHYEKLSQLRRRSRVEEEQRERSLVKSYVEKIKINSLDSKKKVDHKIIEKPKIVPKQLRVCSKSHLQPISKSFKLQSQSRYSSRMNEIRHDLEAQLQKRLKKAQLYEDSRVRERQRTKMQKFAKEKIYQLRKQAEFKFLERLRL